MCLFGRKKELKELEKYYNSRKPEFIAVYGRRRVGKTFLIDEYFQSQYAFYAVGVIDGNRSEQMAAFMRGLRSLGYKGGVPKTWMMAFEILIELLDKKLEVGRRCVIFIDELPCFDTPKAGFVRAFGHF